MNKTHFLLLLPRGSLSHAYLHGARPPAIAHPRASTSLALRDDLRNAGVAALAAAVLISSPMAAEAKGGGHGGGGGGGHSSSYHSSSHGSSSSSRRQLRSTVTPRPSSSRRSSSRRRSSGYTSSRSYSTSSAYASPPPPPQVRLYPDESAARRENGYFCPANLPKPGEKVDIGWRTATVISSTPPKASSLYGNTGGRVLEPVPGFESDCSVEVRYDDDGTTATVSAAQEPASLLEQAAPFLLLGGYQAAIFALDSSYDGGSTRWEAATDRHDELLRELQESSAVVASSSPPLSGEYWGSSEESDDGDQAVRSTLKFGRDGTVTGRGIDGVDGAYRITDGRWGARDRDEEGTVTVAWIEKYDEGFAVVVEGEYRASDGHIDGRFTSDRGVTGGFALKPKPSVF